MKPKIYKAYRAGCITGAIAGLAFVIIQGCATLSPTADPFVVRVEQTQTTASSTFDLVLNVDNANRAFWVTNAPAFHQFCEWLRTPQTYQTLPVPRVVAIQLNVDDLKRSYITSKTTGTSNALWSAWSVMDTAVGQASSWYNIVSTSTHP